MYARFCVGEMIEDDHGHFLKLELPRRKKATMAGEDARLGVHQNRVVEPELGDARRDLRNLRFGMSSRIPCVRNNFSMGHISMCLAIG
jgi:hypothetical protein